LRSRALRHIREKPGTVLIKKGGLGSKTTAIPSAFAISGYADYRNSLT